ncbi:MAG: hypothetical protein K6G47_08630 [Clostridia bacterium]|nr:hypothetical protein [Clostridia bacterium]
MNKDTKRFLTAFLSVVCIISVLTSAGCFRKDKENSPEGSLKEVAKTPEAVKSTLSDDATWAYYPSNNIMGLVALGKDPDEADQTYVLVFDKDAMDENTMQILKEGAVSSMCYYGAFDYKDKEIGDQDGFLYVKLKCDNRIHVVDFCFSYFDEDINEREIITIDSYANSDEGEKMELLFVHYDYGNPKQSSDSKKSQVYDLDKGEWDEINDEEIPEIDDTGIQYSAYYELQVDEDYSSITDTVYNSTEDFYMGVYRYDYLYASYNIYQELISPEEVRLMVMIGTPDSSPLEDVVDPESFFNESDIKLYMKSGDELTDITPDNVWCEFESDVKTRDDNDEFQLTDCTYNVHFQGLGELEEGCYRLVIGDHSYDFKLMVQYFEEW